MKFSQLELVASRKPFDYEPDYATYIPWGWWMRSRAMSFVGVMSNDGHDMPMTCYIEPCIAHNVIPGVVL